MQKEGGGALMCRSVLECERELNYIHYLNTALLWASVASFKSHKKEKIKLISHSLADAHYGMEMHT